MFIVDEASAEAIRRTLRESGEFAATIELRRRFPGVTHTAEARLHVRAIAGWLPRGPADKKRPSPRPARR